MSRPTRFGRFEILGELGRGAMGIVFRARDPDLGREVALKVAVADEVWMGEEEVERFLREARTAGRLRHPGIVTVLEAGRAEGRHYYVMERIEGESLDRRLARQGPLAERDAAALVLELARAVGYAHEAGVLHRDLKPSNVLAATDGRFLLADFGLARPLAGRTPWTRTGAVLGTPGYMAPEQSAGDPGAVDARADVHGLGAILHELLSGRPPGPGAATVDASPELAGIVLRALAPDRDRRTPGARELARELESYLAGGGARPERPVRRSWTSEGRALREVEFEVPLPVAETWRLVADTEHMHRSIGFPPVAYGPATVAASGLFRDARARWFGVLPIAWREYPYEWERERGWSIRREFEGGPLRRATSGIALVPGERGTVLRIHAEASPRAGVLRPLASILAGRLVGAIAGYVREYVERRGTCPEDPLPRPRTRSPVDDDRLAAAGAKLEATATDVGARALLLERLRRGTDEEVVGMRPRVLADDWGVDREALLEVFVEATRQGLLEARWELLCPNCRVPKAGSPALGNLPPAVHCDLCGIDPRIDLDRHVELRFAVHPSIRVPDGAVYCLGGPFRAPHVERQLGLVPGARRELEVRLDQEPRRLRVLRTGQAVELVPEREAAPPAELVLGERGWSTDRLALPRGTSRFGLVNDSCLARVVVLESARWDDRALTAAEAIARSDLSDLVGPGALVPDRSMSIGQVAILAAHDEGQGDVRSLASARRALADSAERHGGRVAGTAGRTSLAVLPTVQQALALALGLAASGRHGLSVHRGPATCHAGPTGSQYDGRAVRLALALAREAGAGAIVLPREVWDEVKGDRPLPAESLECAPAGFGQIEAVRLTGS